MLATRRLIRPPQPRIEITDDEHLIALWLHGKSPHSCAAYRQDLSQFLTFIDHKPLSAVQLEDLQAFATALKAHGYATATQQRRLNAIKSLLAYGYDLGRLDRNVGQRLKPPKPKRTLAERILSEAQVLALIAATTTARDHALLRLLYATGARVSEVCALCWHDFQPVAQGRAQVTLFGKGSKTRAIVFSAATWQIMQRLRQDADGDAPVFVSRRGRHLHATQVQRLVRAASARAGIAAPVSPHWLRHAHACHAIDRGAPLHLVQATLGHASLATTGLYLHVRPHDSSALHLSV